MDFINNKIDIFCQSSVPNKIMTILILKNMAHGLYRGIANFKSSNKPVTQFLDNVVSFTIWGFIEAIFWPFSITYMVTYELDKVANFLMNKKCDNTN